MDQEGCSCTRFNCSNSRSPGQEQCDYKYPGSKERGDRARTYSGTPCSSFCLLSSWLKKLMIPSKTVFLLPCKAGHYIKPLQGLQYPREQYSIPTSITNLRVSFISLHKLLRQVSTPLWLISKFPVFIFLLTALISFDCIIE